MISNIEAPRHAKPDHQILEVVSVKNPVVAGGNHIEAPFPRRILRPISERNVGIRLRVLSFIKMLIDKTKLTRPQERLRAASVEVAMQADVSPSRIFRRS